MKEKFGRWDILLWQYLKRDWKKIALWVLGLGLFSSAFVPTFEEIAEGGGLAGMFETMRNPAMIAIVGPTPVKTPSEYTVGAMYAQEMLLFCALFAMTVSILHVVGHTRKEEDLGLTELVRSFQVGRQANSLAVLVETVLVNVLLGLFTALVLMSFRTPTISASGSLLFGASVAAGGILGAALALVMAQIMPVASAATGSSLGIMGFLFILRGATDISQPQLSRLNPLAWSYLTYPFTQNNLGPLLSALAFSILLPLFAFALEGARDMGAGYLAPREGRATAGKSLLSVPGLLLRLNRAVIISWLLAFVILGAAYGAVYGDMESFLESNELMRQMFLFSGISMEESFSGTILMVMVALVTILPIAIMNRLFSEEKNLRLSQIHGTKVKRSQLYWTTVALAVANTVLGIFLAAGSLGGIALTVLASDSMSLADFFVMGYNYFPSALFFVGLAGLILGWRPQWGKLLYVYLTYAFFLSYFGAVLNLPNWVRQTAPQSWAPQLPAENFTLRPFLLVSAISVVLMVVGSVGYNRRDRVEGA